LLTRTAYEALRDMIVRGRLAPGARLIETELADALGISRTPVRDAMARLVQDGLAVAPRGGGRVQLIVAPLTAADLQELYTVMGALEGAVGRQAAALSPVDRKALARAMAAAHDAFERVARVRPPDFERMFELHNAFHAVLVERAATGRLHALIDQVSPHIHRYEYLYAGVVGPDYSATFAEHRAIVRAIRSGSAARAERAVRANWDNSARRLAVAAPRFPALGAIAPGRVSTRASPVSAAVTR
jgi:DNA-binding GntR family transcriptional regulator